MSVPLGVVRLVASGNLASGEVFAFGVWFNYTITSGQAQLDALCDLYAAQLLAHGAPIFTQFNTNDTAITQVSGYAYTDASGEATLVSHRPAAVVGGASVGNELPLQCAIVVSTRTATNGRRFRGRFYVPLTAATLVAHQITVAQATAMGAAWKAIFATLSTASPAAVPTVVSATGTVSTPITQLIIDTRVDIQRRRANKQAIVGSAITAIP